VSLEAIKAAIPHRDPFLLLDEIVEQSESRIVCRKRFTGDEFWYRGHYPQFPITPGVLLCEAAMQAGAVLLSKHAADEPDAVPVATRANNVQFKQMVLPGDTIEIEVELVERLANAFFMKARVTTGGKVACRFEFACTLAKRETDTIA
jgi:3-hydroxyacyl-[acyl-carrier-protein] dehydratase